MYSSRIFTFFVLGFVPLVFADKLSMEDIQNFLKTTKDMCLKKVGVAEEIVDSMYVSNTFPDDPGYKCFMKCILMAMSIIRENKLRADVLNRKIETMMLPELVPHMQEVCIGCINKVPADLEDACEASYIYAKCLWETDRTLYVIPQAGT